MTKQEQKEFLESVIDNFKASILEKVDKLPSEWEGVYLREYLQEKSKSAFVWTCYKNTQITKEVKNDITIHNL